jgi:hypothetical protein
MSVWQYRFRAYANWLKAPLHFWIAAAGTIVVLALMYLAIHSGAKLTQCPDYERCIRIAGLVFQLAGVGTVISGISATRRVFGLPGFFAPLRTFLQRLPPWTPKTLEMTGAASLGRVSGRAHASLWMNAGPDDPVEKRITALENNLADVNARLSQLVADNNTRLNEIIDRITSGHSEANNRMNQIESTMRTASTGGIYLSMTGAFWIAIGILMSTVPSELSSWWCSP